MNAAQTPHVVIIGAGFAGLEAAKTLRRAPARVTLIDRRNHHVFAPLLYEVATAALSPSDVATAVRTVVYKSPNFFVQMAEVTGIDLAARRIDTHSAPIHYDHLILAAGAEPNYFGHPEWETHAPSLKDLTHALEIRRRILSAYEAAELETDPVRKQELLTFIVIGGGPTGVELAGTMADVAHKTLACDFRRFDPNDTRIVLIEGGPRLLPAMKPELGDYAAKTLRERGVEIRLGQMARRIDETGVTVGEEHIAAATVLWAAGVKASPLVADLGTPLQKGHVVVERDLSISGHREVFAVGDLMWFEQDGAPLPWVAQVALQSGRHAARCILADFAKRPRAPFRYRHKGAVASIARGKAVAELPHATLTGLAAWLLAWVVHIFWLISRRDRFAVFLGWAYSYLTWRRDARLILPQTNVEPRRPVLEAAPHDSREVAAIEHFERFAERVP